MRSLFILLLFISAAAAEPPTFSRDIAPIFEKNCAGCHNAESSMGGLALDTWEHVQKGGKGGPVIVPGKSAESRLFQMVSHKKEPAMPIGGNSLAAGELSAIAEWIDGGAKPGSTGTAPKKPAIPDIRPRSAVHNQIGTLAYSPDGRLIALGSFREVRLADPVTGTTVATLPNHAEQVRAVAFSPDGKLLAAAGGLPGQSGEVKIWDVSSRRELLTIRGHRDCIYAVAFAPDGKTIATSSYDKLIRIWDVSSGKELHVLKDHIDAIYAVAFTPDGKRLLSASADRSVKVWDTATGERLFTLSESTDALNTLAIDPTGKFVAAGGLDKTIRIWSLSDSGGTLLHSLIAHEDAILQLAWSPDGNTLVSAAADRSLKTFRAADLVDLKEFPRQPDWVMALQFSPDGKHFAAGRYDGSLAFFDNPTDPKVAKK
jgi:DNA-binding beta-propeller fold protein YncE